MGHSATDRIMAALITALAFDPARALDEVNAEYSTTTERADTLQRVANVVAKPKR
jgi:argininosuccinate lyase